nr:OmpA family protein [uncultured Flavobacterium sp.]
MKRAFIALSVIALTLTSCGAKKQIAELQAKNKEIQDLLNTCTVKLNTCLAERNQLDNEVNNLRKNNSDLINNVGNLTTLTKKGAENLEKSLESLKEKDLRITRLQDALTKKDSVTLALVSALKSDVGMQDPDININVEKGVIMISIADNLLFKSGSYQVSEGAKQVLNKVAQVIKAKPDFECMIEGHTDNLPIKNSVLQDNWDLSVKRATSIVRVLHEDLGVDPKQLIPAGRSFYVPLASNDSPNNRSKNRRTKVIIMPKIDQFYDMVEKEMKNLSEQK